MLGAIIGDMVGSVYEFNNTKRIDFRFFSDRSTYTDDSIMTIAVAEWLLSDRNHSHEILEDIMVRYAGEYPHPMGGYGGAIKQLSIGCASAFGKAYIHGAGEPEKIWTADHDSFLESMADAAANIVDYFKGNLLYVNVMKNMSVDCDCCAVAEDPCIGDIGILVSTDPVAIDQACIDLVYASTDPGRPHLLERIESRNGVHTIEAAAALGYGSREYELVEVE